MTFNEFWDDYVKNRVPGDSVKNIVRAAYEAGEAETRKTAEARVDRLLREFVFNKDNDRLSIL